LLPVLCRDALLIGDATKAYTAFPGAAGTTHDALSVRAGMRARSAIHFDNVNGWHGRFKAWLRRFDGMASRYLANDTGWQRLLDARRTGVAGRFAARRRPGNRSLTTSLVSSGRAASISGCSRFHAFFQSPSFQDA
jgi:hypothetical protein